MLIEGNKNVRKAKIKPKNDIDKLLILKGSSSSLSNSLEIVIREEFSLNLLLTNCFEFVYFKSFTCEKLSNKLNKIILQSKSQ